MQTVDKVSPEKASEKNSATLTITFENGDVKTLGIHEGEVFVDVETGAFKIESVTGAKFVFIPDERRFTGKRKRRLKLLHNLY
jgi:hypothetical protein